MADHTVSTSAPVVQIPVHRRGIGVVAHTVVDIADADLASVRWGMDPQGYVRGSIDCRRVYLHRTILERCIGTIPADRVTDHINRQKCDNRRSNLRCVTPAENTMNRDLAAIGIKVGRTLGSRGLGVTWLPKRGKWQAQLIRGARPVWLGRFTSKDEAVAAVQRYREANAL